MTTANGIFNPIKLSKSQPFGFKISAPIGEEIGATKVVDVVTVMITVNGQGDIFTAPVVVSVTGVTNIVAVAPETNSLTIVDKINKYFSTTRGLQLLLTLTSFPIVSVIFFAPRNVIVNGTTLMTKTTSG